MFIWTSSSLLPTHEAMANRRSSVLNSKVLLRVFSEDFSRNSKEILILLPLPGKKILDPRSQVVQQWNRIFLFICFVSLFLDPLFFYLPIVRSEQCIEIRRNAEIILTVLRSFADVFYLIQIGVRFRTAYVAPSSRVFGRGELVIDLSKISSRYFANSFAVDLVAALPLPQVNTHADTSLHSRFFTTLPSPQLLLWGVIPYLEGSTMTNTKNILRLSIIIQYIPRLFIIIPLSSEIVKNTGVITKTAWAGAAYNLLLYMLASHV